MATRKVRKKKKPVSRSGKLIVIRIGKKVYSAPFRALGRDFADGEVLTKIYALEKKSCCHGLHFAGVFSGTAYERAFGNGRFPPH
jgi:hypothetical protein